MLTTAKVLLQYILAKCTIQVWYQKTEKLIIFVFTCNFQCSREPATEIPARRRNPNRRRFLSQPFDLRDEDVKALR
jgi:hypothetical protein